MAAPVDPLRDSYLSELQRALFLFQMIEEGLKTYIADAHAVVQHALPPELIFRSDPKEYENAPLERLIALYSKVTRNEGLVAKLNKLREPRNHCAHRGFALAFLSRVNKTVNLRTEHARVAQAGALAAEAFEELQHELGAMAATKSRYLAPSMQDIALKSESDA